MLCSLLSGWWRPSHVFICLQYWLSDLLSRYMYHCCVHGLCGFGALGSGRLMLPLLLALGVVSGSVGAAQSLSNNCIRDNVRHSLVT